MPSSEAMNRSLSTLKFPVAHLIILEELMKTRYFHIWSAIATPGTRECRLSSYLFLDEEEERYFEEAPGNVVGNGEEESLAWELVMIK